MSSGVLAQNGSQTQLKHSRSAASGDGFWATVLRNRSEGKLRRLLNTWLQESLTTTNGEGGSPHPDSEVNDAKRRAYEQQVGASRGRHMSRERSQPRFIGQAPEYAYHAKDAEGTPRTNSPDDVMTTNLGEGGGGGSSPSSPNGVGAAPSFGAPPPPEPSGATGGDGVPDLPDIGATPSTVEVFRGEAVAAQLESGLRANREHSAGSGSLGGGSSSAGGSGAGGAPSESVGSSSRHGAASAQLEHAMHAMELAPATDSVDRSISCIECQIKIEGPVFMLNDHPYCCQRHRLLAYHKYERGQINARGLSASATAGYAQSGLRASFQAWM